MQLNEALKQASDLDSWLDSKISPINYKVDPESTEEEVDQVRMSMALLQLVQELHKSIEVLLTNGLIGSAFALLRPTFETLVRAVWLLRASLAEVRRYKKDRVPLIGEMMDSLAEKNVPYGAWFWSLKGRAWKAMCSYAHGGFFQATNRITEADISPRYSVEAQVEIVRLSGFLAVLSALECAFICDEQEVAKEIAAKGKTWYPEITDK